MHVCARLYVCVYAYINVPQSCCLSLPINKRFMFGVAPAVAGAVDSTSQSLGGGASVPSEDALAVANAFGKQFTLLKKINHM